MEILSLGVNGLLPAMLIRRSTEKGPVTRVEVPKIAPPAVLRDWVEELSVPRHFHFESGENRRIALWLLRTLGDWGYEVAFHGESRNVVATPPGVARAGDARRGAL